MARRATKSASTEYLDFSDLSGGWNCRDAEENIANNELADVTNMTYADAMGRLRLRKGTGAPLHTFSADIDGMVWYNSKLCVAAEGKLWEWNDVGAGSMSEIGALSGTKRPSFQEFGGELFIATGAKIQKYDGSSLSTIEDSYEDTIGLFMRDGRLCCWRSAPEFADYIYASYAGDASTWTVPSDRTDADPVEIQIGYKMAGKIVAVVPMLSDLIIFKENLVMRLVGGLINTEGIYEVARNIDVTNQWCVANVGGTLYYIDKTRGAQLLEGVETYGDILPGETLQKVNPYLREHIDDADSRLWYLKMRGILVYGMGNNICIPAYLSFGTGLPALKWEFDGEVRDIVEPDRERLYIAIGKKLFSLTEESDEGSEGIAHGWKTRRVTGPSFFLLKRIALDASTDVEFPSNQPVRLYVNDVEYAQMAFGDTSGTAVYANNDPVLGNDSPALFTITYRNDFTKHQTFRGRGLQFRFEGDASRPYTFSLFRAEVVPVGVIG